MPANTPAPGWYPDQTNSAQLRWWDGQSWSEQTKPLDVPVVQQPPAAPPAWGSSAVQPVAMNAASKKPWYFRWWSITAAVLIALTVVGSFLPNEETPGAEATASESSASSAASPGTSEPVVEPEPVDSDGDGVNDDEDYRPKDPKVKTENDVDTDKDGVADFEDAFPKDAKYSEDADGDGVADPIDAFPKDPDFSKDTDADRVADSEDAFPRDPSRSEITLAMENALGSAESYLEYTAFSRLGLIGQLSSEYGEGFTVEDATWAVDQLGADWKEQAFLSGKGYLEYSSFSRQGLIDQLSSAYGEQFTLDEATYAVNKIGL